MPGSARTAPGPAAPPELTPGFTPRSSLWKTHYTTKRHCFHRAPQQKPKRSLFPEQRTADAALHLTLLPRLRAWHCAFTDQQQCQQCRQHRTAGGSSFAAAQPAASLPTWEFPQNAFLHPAISFTASYLSVTATAGRNTCILFSAFSAVQKRTAGSGSSTARCARAASRAALPRTCHRNTRLLREKETEFFGHSAKDRGPLQPQPAPTRRAPTHRHRTAASGAHPTADPGRLSSRPAHAPASRPSVQPRAYLSRAAAAG